ncbi:MAG: thiamine-phosphate pyrophosphorylase [Candidatus Kaelpia imicola]|nr:thiamine-phosphate pyrophosphorylase [Candidatus Kaelpia imicola]
MQKESFRIVDANFNRAREGLRVCEDIMRFIYSKSDSALKLKKTRRSLSLIIAQLSREELLKRRDLRADKGKFRYAKGSKFRYDDILRFNFQRVTEALRVLEEVSQVLKPQLKQKFMRLRFKVYDIEKDSFAAI